jgi:hypothetical protein
MWQLYGFLASSTFKLQNIDNKKNKKFLNANFKMKKNA